MSRSLTLLLALTACGPIAPGDADPSTDPSTSTGTAGDASTSATTLADRQQTSSSAPLPETDSATPPDLGATEPTESSSGGEDISSTSGGVLPTCYGEPCDGECGDGMVCRPTPQNGVRVCVVPCSPALTCDVGTGLCSPTGAPPLAECIEGGCFPLLCEVVDDCPAGALECVAGICF